MRCSRWPLWIMVPLAVFIVSGWGGQSLNQANAAATGSVADFYKDKVVTLIITSRPGGTTDLAARMFSAYWNQYTGGYMKLVNEAGGGGLVGGNQTFSARPDGLTICTGEYGGDVIGPGVLRPKGLQYEIAKFNYLGLFAGDAYAFALSAKAPYNTIDELKQAKRLRMAGMSPGGTSNTGASLVADALGISSAVNIFGHEGLAEAGLAMGMGELDAYAMTGSSITDQITKGWVKKPLLIISTAPSKIFPGVPLLSEVAKLSPNHQRILAYYVSTLKPGKAFYTTPGVPEDKVEFLRETFNKIVADKAFVSQAKLRWPAWEDPIPGKELTALVAKAVATTPEVIKLVTQLNEKYNKK